MKNNLSTVSTKELIEELTKRDNVKELDIHNINSCSYAKIFKPCKLIAVDIENA